MNTIAPGPSVTSELNQLDQLKKFTKVVADSADFESMRKFHPQDATTNPTLVYQATQKSEYAHILEKVIVDRKSSALSGGARIEEIMDHLLVAFGCEILNIVPGRVSTEVDARLSFDIESTCAKARRLIALYEAKGVPRERILIKIASTWEGIAAAGKLQTEGIRCNLTVLFTLAQAVRCAEEKVQLISPFVGRICEWFKAANKREYSAAEDPGVHALTAIYNYYKKFDYKTEVMGAAIRNPGQATELAGCDLLTIPPVVLAQLVESNDPVTRKLDAGTAKHCDIQRLALDEKTFRWLLNEDAMATEKIAEGIRLFAADIAKLENFIAAKL